MLVQSAAFGGVFTGFGIARDFESGFARRLLLAAPNRTGIVLGYALSAMVRWAVTATVLTVVALIAGVEVFGGPVDVFGLYLLALLINVCGLLWTCGVAMRLRTMQAGPLMQLPVFLVLFFAPVLRPAHAADRVDRDVRDAEPAHVCARGGAQHARRRRGVRRRCIRGGPLAHPALLRLVTEGTPQRRGGRLANRLVLPGNRVAYDDGCGATEGGG